MMQFINTLIAAIRNVFQWLSNKQLIDAGKDAAAVEAVKEVQREVYVANNARETARAEHSDVSGPTADSLPDDGFRRD